MSRTIVFLRLAGFHAGWVEDEPGRFRTAAEAFWQRCAELTPFVEPLADHEAFLDLTGFPGSLPPALAGLEKDLRRLLGIPELALWAGLATNRLVARLAAERAERTAKGGFLAVPPCREADFLASQPPSALWTVPAPVRETLSRLGLATLAEVRALPEPALRRLFGPEAHRLLRHAWGQDDSPVPLLEHAAATRTARSLRCLERVMEFALPPSGRAEVALFLRDAAAALAAELHEKGWQALRLQVTLELADGPVRRVRTTPREPPATSEVLYAALTEASRRLWGEARPENPPQRLRVQIEAVAAAVLRSTQLPLFADRPSVQDSWCANSRRPLRPRVLDEVLAAVNRAFSAEVLFPAARLKPSRRERLRRLRPEFGCAAP